MKNQRLLIYHCLTSFYCTIENKTKMVDSKWPVLLNQNSTVLAPLVHKWPLHVCVSIIRVRKLASEIFNFYRHKLHSSRRPRHLRLRQLFVKSVLVAKGKPNFIWYSNEIMGFANLDCFIGFVVDQEDSWQKLSGQDVFLIRKNMTEKWMLLHDKAQQYLTCLWADTAKHDVCKEKLRCKNSTWDCFSF